MKVEDRYREQYRAKSTPWDIGKPDFNLIEMVDQTPIPKCKVLDIGCGTGDNSIWLAQNDFITSATDTSAEALEIAKEKAIKENVNCRFFNLNILNQIADGAPFGFAFDRGCFHSFGSAEDRNKFAKNVAAHLEEGGLWLTLVGNADEQRDTPGPPQRSAGDIILAVEPYFEVLSLVTTHFGSNRPKAPRAWRCLLRKRNL